MLTQVIDAQVFQGRGEDYGESETLYYASAMRYTASGRTAEEAVQELLVALRSIEGVAEVLVKM